MVKRERNAVLDLLKVPGEARQGNADLAFDMIDADRNRFLGRLNDWWLAYKDWEQGDTFNAAVQARRMTMRTFSKDFAKVVRRTRTIDLAENRIFPNRTFAPSVPDPSAPSNSELAQRLRDAKFASYSGLDATPYRDPANFATRDARITAGLYDVSVSLLDARFSLLDQSHVSDTGAHYSFMPLSKPEDQALLYDLIRAAKAMDDFGELRARVREFRAEMTRVKLANNYDMGTGFSAVYEPDGTGRAFRVRYSLGRTLKVRGVAFPPRTTPDSYLARQQQAVDFTSIINLALNTRQNNEMTIAIRRHAGPFPVYAERISADTLQCFTLVGGQKVPSGSTIDDRGVMT